LNACQRLSWTRVVSRTCFSCSFHVERLRLLGSHLCADKQALLFMHVFRLKTHGYVFQD
jgi:hypothetical protein